ncbi:MAG: hypothetical protein ABWX74_21020 [Aeromicrobium sp.]
MSDLQSIATKLRALAKDSGDTADAVRGTTKVLRSLGGEVDRLKRRGIDTRQLSGAIQEAEAKAVAAAHAAKTVQSKGEHWADLLAAGGGGSSSGSTQGSESAPSRDQQRRDAYGDLTKKAVAGFFSPDVAHEWVPPFAGAVIGTFLGDANGDAVEALIDTTWDMVDNGAIPYGRGLLTTFVRDARSHLWKGKNK